MPGCTYATGEVAREARKTLRRCRQTNPGLYVRLGLPEVTFIGEEDEVS